MNILLANCPPRKCGVYQFGASLIDCLRSVHGKHKMLYEECEHIPILLEQADFVIWNHHPLTTPWLTSSITDLKPSALIVHDTKFPWSKKTFYLHSDPTLIETARDLRIGRPILPPLFEPPPVIPNSVGSFGFGFDPKGFEDLIHKVNDEYDQAIVRLNIPFNDSVDGDGLGAKLVARRCFSLAKPGITVYISFDYLDEEELLTWLAQHEVNAFLYKNNESKGLASTIDWAIRARRPIVVSGLQMFRHIHHLIAPNETFKEAIKQGTSRLQGLYDTWTPASLHQDLERIIERVFA